MNFSPKAIIFDMDGVIVDNLSYHFDALVAFLAKYGYTLSQEEFRQNINGRTIQEVIQHYINPDLSHEEIMRLSEEKEALYRSLYQTNLKATKGLMAFLMHCQQQYLPLAVATSAIPANVTFTLDGLGIRSSFRSIVDGTQVKRGKPHPEIYLKALAALGTAASHTWVIEDALAGIAAGKAAGMPVAGITTTHHAEELRAAGADFIFADFDELLQIFLRHGN
jgi:beta-phosphoglucomutase